MLFKIYCENIVVAFLNCHFLFFILFFLSFVHTFLLLSFFFFFFFSCFFSTIHVCPLLFPSSPFFSTSFSFSTRFQNLSLFFFIQLSLFLLFFFFFYLIPKHSLALRDKKRRKRQREKEQVRDLACSTVDQRTQAGGESAFTVPSHAFRSAATCLPPQRSPNGSNGLCLFSLFFSFFVLLL